MFGYTAPAFRCRGIFLSGQCDFRWPAPQAHRKPNVTLWCWFDQERHGCVPIDLHQCRCPISVV